MDLEEYWQENKRFLARVGVGLAAFLIGMGIVNATVGSERTRMEANVATAQRGLSAAFFTAADRELAESDNDALSATVAALRAQVEFVPRDEFRSAVEPNDAPRFINVASRMRAELLPLARRRNVAVDPTLGLPDRSPTRADDIERHLDGLDVIERVVRAAIEERVAKVTSIAIRVDPGLNSRKGVGTIERTRIVFEMSGDDLALQRLLARTQLAEPAPLIIESASFARSPRDPQVVVLELTILAARVKAAPTDEQEPS